MNRIDIRKTRVILSRLVKLERKAGIKPGACTLGDLKRRIERLEAAAARARENKS